MRGIQGQYLQLKSADGGHIRSAASHESLFISDGPWKNKAWAWNKTICFLLSRPQLLHEGNRSQKSFVTSPPCIISLADKMSLAVSVNKQEDSRLKPEHKRKFETKDWFLDLTNVSSIV